MKQFFLETMRFLLAVTWFVGFLALTYAFVRVVAIAWKG